MADIELAQSIQKDKNDDAEAKKKAETAKPHPFDVNYGLLKCSLEHVDNNSDEFKVIIRQILWFLFNLRFNICLF